MAGDSFSSAKWRNEFNLFLLFSAVEENFLSRVTVKLRLVTFSKIVTNENGGVIEAQSRYTQTEMKRGMKRRGWGYQMELIEIKSAFQTDGKVPISFILLK